MAAILYSAIGPFLLGGEQQPRTLCQMISYLAVIVLNKGWRQHCLLDLCTQCNRDVAEFALTQFTIDIDVQTV